MSATRPAEALAVLGGVDAARAQTWNRLSINDTTLEVPAASGDAPALPAWAEPVRLVAGADAVAWLDAASGDAEVVGDGGECVVRLMGDGEGRAVRSTLMRVPTGATGAVRVAATGAAGVTGHVLRIVAEEGSDVTVDVLVARLGDATHLQAIGATLAEGATLALRIWVLGAATTALSVACDLEGDRSRLTNELRYLGAEGQRIDVTYDVRQLGRDTEAAIGASGVLTAGASKTLRASIDLVRGCKGSVGSESETVLVAGDGVRNQTLPVILCTEDDVEGNHGATIGSLSAEQAAYLAGRGLGTDDVVALMSQAIIDDAASATDQATSTAIVSWCRATRGRDASAQAADAAAMVHGTLCDIPREPEL